MSVIKTQLLFFLYNYIKFLCILTRIRFLLVSILFTHNFIVFLFQISVLRQMPNVEVLSLRFELGSESLIHSRLNFQPKVFVTALTFLSLVFLFDHLKF